jgi:hypothetical protein
MPDINVTVTGTPPQGTYTSSSNKVESDGTISINPGITTIEFDRGNNQNWNFVSPWITFSPSSSPFTVDTANCGDGQVSMSDNDPGGGQDATYEYTLYTNLGNFDPEIINKGSNPARAEKK